MFSASPKVEANKVHRLLDRIIPSVLSHGAETWPGNELKLISRNRGRRRRERRLISKER